MKLSQFGRITLAAVAVTAMSLTITACSIGHAVDYLYVASSRGSTISAYTVDNNGGSLSTIATYPSAGTTPVAEVVSPNGKYLYVANNATSNIAMFAINTDGSLTAGKTVTIPGTGTLPTALATDPEGLNLLATFTYRAGTSGAGGVAVYPISATDGSLGTGVSYNVGNKPVGINVTDYLKTTHIYFTYVVDQADSAVLGFSLNATTGVLTAISPSSYPAGVTPSAIASGPTAQYVYVTDEASNQVIGYVIQSNGALVPMVNGPFGTGSYPVAITIDPRGLYMYITNYNDSTISSYALNVTTGAPATVAAASSQKVGTYPDAICIDPSLGVFLYTGNYLDNSVSGLILDAHSGALSNIQNTPFNTGAGPSAVVAVAAGDHSTQFVQP
jgi:6-phosphogluconolactonase (cycloisomerase 2 family)